MISVGVHPPKTPVTKGSMGIASATLPNVCKMPGPPAPFVPAPLPNIAKSGSSPKGYSKKVKIEGKEIAIRGAMFESMGDMASKGTGGGLISANTHGPAKFITPGSLTVKIEGKSVHLLGEPMLNNCGPSGSPPNTGATLNGVKQGNSDEPEEEKCPPHVNLEITEGDVDKKIEDGDKKKSKLNEKVEEFKAEKESAESNAAKARIQRKINQCLKGIKKIDSERPSLLWEKKVADDLKEDDSNVKTDIKIRCLDCNKVITQFDAVGSKVAKEAKSSSGGYKPDQHDIQKDLVEERGIFGPGISVHVAVPEAQKELLESDNPELKDRVQGH